MLSSFIPHPIEQKRLERNSHHQGSPKLSERRKDPVSFLKDRTASNLAGFLTPNGCIGAQSPLPLKHQTPLVCQSNEEHLLIQGHQVADDLLVVRVVTVRLFHGVARVLLAPQALQQPAAPHPLEAQQIPGFRQMEPEAAMSSARLPEKRCRLRKNWPRGMSNRMAATDPYAPRTVKMP
jgi:hypothetical protein